MNNLSHRIKALREELDELVDSGKEDWITPHVEKELLLLDMSVGDALNVVERRWAQDEAR